jgi:ABC-2 type transport system ATP-binding protein
MDEAIIKVEGLVKGFGGKVPVRALDGLDLTVEHGGVYGLLGPNGAGKTTLIRVLTTLLPADAGSARVAGVDVRQHPDQVRARIGLAGQYAAVDDHLTGRENVELVGRLYGRPRRQASRRDLWALIGDLVDTGTTVLLTTQYLEEADQLADRIAVIDHGRVVSEGTPDQLKDRVGGAVLELTVPGGHRARARWALRTMQAEDPADEQHRGRIVLPAPDGVRTLSQALRRLDAAGVVPEDLALRRPTLDDVFLALTGHLATTPTGNSPEPSASADRHGQQQRERAAR